MAKKPAPTAGPEASRDSGVHAVVLLAGPEAFLRNSRTADIRKKLESHHGEIDVVTFDGATAQASDVLDECRSFGLMAAHKLVIVDQFDELIAEVNRAAFERYVAAPPDGATLVLRAKTAKKTAHFEKAVMASGGLIECEALSEPDALRWVGKHAKQEYRAAIEPEAAAALVSRVGTSMMQLHSELGKLAAAAGKANTITTALVGEFVGVSREEEAWGIQRTLLGGNANSALAHLRHLMGVSRQPPQVVMYAMTDLARKLHALSAGHQAGRSTDAIARALRVWGKPQDVQALHDMARNTHPTRTLAFLRACLKADERAKTGLTDTERALEMLVVRLYRMLRRS